MHTNKPNCRLRTSKKRKYPNLIKCPKCGGKLSEMDCDKEIILCCSECWVSIDSDGGIID